MMEDELRQVIIINADLKMGKGKIAAQAAHASVWATLNSIVDERTLKWLQQSYVKVVLKATEKEMKELLEELVEAYPPIEFYVIHDEGRTEVKAGSMTAIALQPLKKSETGKVQLLTKLNLL
jgi:PTH2 family peptidyl-tRNA hydrolase